ncbi:unnamed protein product [Darwinula stevensoni]|uniref:Uncharacterized protein n=1 Tax=Darwinula stevensoni TaxID=69355 RepID=A0A7R8X9Z3_9CRUS|nr:unnamed protein product [Darwinula stevensoni]CAG0883058.1 unnamed protein product [Darwinula stevensoni]
MGGMLVNIISSTLIDLAANMGKTPEEVAYIMFMRSGGFLIGALCCISIASVPFSDTPFLFSFAFMLAGIFSGLIDTACNVTILDMWGGESGPYMQALHFCFGLGGVIIPEISKEFLSKEGEEEPGIIARGLFGTYTEGQPYSQVYVSYLIDFKLAHINREDTKSGIQISPCIKNSMIAILSTIICLYVGIELSYGQVGFFFAVYSPISFTKKEAAHLTSAYWGFYTGARFLAVPLSTFMNPGILILGDFVLAIIGGTVVLVAGEWNRTALWVGTALMGLGTGPMFPSSILWFEKYITVTSALASLFLVFSAIGEMVFPSSLTAIIETHPSAFPKGMLMNIISSTLIDLAANMGKTPDDVAYTIISAASVPFSDQPFLMCFAFMLCSLFSGIVDTVCNVTLLDMWGGDSGHYMQALHFCFGLGGVIIPEISKEFLSKEGEEEPGIIARGLFGTYTANQPYSRVYVPYLIVCGVMILVALSFLYFHMQDFKLAHINRGDAKSGMQISPLTQKSMITLMCIIIFLYVGIELTYGQVIFFFAVYAPVSFTKKEAAHLTSAYWGFYTGARFLAVPLSAFMNPSILIFGDFVLAIIGGTVVLVAGEWNRTALWVGTALMGLGTGPMFPSSILWFEKYITVTSALASLFLVFSAIGEMILLSSLTAVIETHPSVFPKVMSMKGDNESKEGSEIEDVANPDSWSIILGQSIWYFVYAVDSISTNNITILDIRGLESGPYMQALHLCFGIGGVLIPQIAKPSLSHEDEEVGACGDPGMQNNTQLYRKSKTVCSIPHCLLPHDHRFPMPFLVFHIQGVKLGHPDWENKKKAAGGSGIKEGREAPIDFHWNLTGHFAAGWIGLEEVGGRSGVSKNVRVPCWRHCSHELRSHLRHRAAELAKGMFCCHVFGLLWILHQFVGLQVVIRMIYPRDSNLESITEHTLIIIEFDGGKIYAYE